MPSNTFYKLNPAKQKRVYDASLKEFCRVTLEDVSIKNIVRDASIARGSFYQYFSGKEDLLLYLIHSLRSDMEPTIDSGENIFQFIYSLAMGEIRGIIDNPGNPPVKSRLLRNMASSPTALFIFEKDIGESLKTNRRFQRVLDDSGLSELEDSVLTALVELLAQALRHAVIQVLSSSKSPEEALKILKIKLNVIQKGLN